MTPTKIKIGSSTYYSTHETARRLGVSDRTLLRWVEWLKRGWRPEELVKLEWIRQPISRFHYFSAVSVAKTRRRLKAGRRLQPNGYTH